MEKNRLCKAAIEDFVNGRLYGYGWGLCGRVHINPHFSLSKSSVGEFGWDGAGGCFSMVDRKNKTSLFFGMHILGCNYSYVVLQSVIRNLGGVSSNPDFTVTSLLLGVVRRISINTANKIILISVHVGNFL